VSRDDKVEEYESWISGKYVEMQPDGSILAVPMTQADIDRRIKVLGHKYVDDIKHALQLNADEIFCSCADKDVFDWVVAQFTPAELSKVTFTYMGVPSPTVTKRI